jgi:lipopolysaccharide export system permease protein
MKKIIYTYIFREMIPHFAASLIVFTFLILAGKILQLTEWMVNHNTQLEQVLLITIYSLPSVFFFTLPMATLLASLIAFSRLNEDNEITALKSSGVSLYQIIPPVVGFSIAIYLFASLIAIYLFPVGNYSMARVLFDVGRSSTMIGIKQGIFNDSIPNMVLYANYISAHDQTMEGVFIFDERDPSLSNTIIAQKGGIRSNTKQMSLHLQLKDGSMYMVSKDLESSKLLNFKSYDLKVELSDIIEEFSSRRRDNKELSISKLREKIQETKEGTIVQKRLIKELHKRFSVPFTCLIFGLIGLPLGLMMRARGRSYGVVISIGIFIIHYILMTAADSMGKTGTLNPILAAWIPNLIMGIVTLILILWVARD